VAREGYKMREEKFLIFGVVVCFERCALKGRSPCCYFCACVPNVHTDGVRYEKALTRTPLTLTLTQFFFIYQF
jgi:hypothetical protein